MSDSIVINKKTRLLFTDSYNKYYPYIFKIDYSKTGDEQDSSDICQEVLLLYFKKFDEIENPRKWLYGTMKNILYQYYRRKQKSAIDIDALLEDSNLAYVNGFRNTRIIIQDAIDNAEINEEERLLIEYIALNGFSYTNTSNILGLTKKQVLFRYEKSVKKILSYFNEKGIKNIEDLL